MAVAHIYRLHDRVSRYTSFYSLKRMNVDNFQHIFTLVFKYERRGLKPFRWLSTLHFASVVCKLKLELTSQETDCNGWQLFSSEKKIKWKLEWTGNSSGSCIFRWIATSKCGMYLAMTEMGIDIIGGDVVPFLSAYLSFILLKHLPIYFYHLTLRCNAPYETCVKAKTSA